MKIILTETQLKKIIDGEIDEKSRSFAFTRKKRLFPEPAKKYAKNRFRFADRIDDNTDDTTKDNGKKKEKTS